MKKKVLEISDRLREGIISTNQALAEILELTGKIYEGVTYNGHAKVKDDSNYVYAGHTFEITGVYCIHMRESSPVYEVGSKEYILSLVGTEFEHRNEKSPQEYTVIHENHLDIIDLEVVDLNDN